MRYPIIPPVSWKSRKPKKASLKDQNPLLITDHRLFPSVFLLSFFPRCHHTRLDLIGHLPQTSPPVAKKRRRKKNPSLLSDRHTSMPAWANIPLPTSILGPRDYADSSLPPSSSPLLRDLFPRVGFSAIREGVNWPEAPSGGEETIQTGATLDSFAHRLFAPFCPPHPQTKQLGANFLRTRKQGKGNRRRLSARLAIWDTFDANPPSSHHHRPVVAHMPASPPKQRPISRGDYFQLFFLPPTSNKKKSMNCAPSPLPSLIPLCPQHQEGEEEEFLIYGDSAAADVVSGFEYYMYGTGDGTFW